MNGPEADWPCLNLGSAKVGPVEWKLGWAGRVKFKKLPGPF